MNMREFNDAQQREALVRILNMRNDAILSKSMDEWVADLVEQYGAPDIPQVDPAGITRTQHQGQVPSRPVPNPPFGGHVPTMEGLIHNIHIPFTGDRNFFHFQPPYNVDKFPGGAVEEHKIVLSMGGAWLKPQDIERLVNRQLELIEKALKSFRGDAERFRHRTCQACCVQRFNAAARPRKPKPRRLPVSSTRSSRI
jgi:hypothetical protein